MVGGEEWGGVTGEGEENFVEHCESGLAGGPFRALNLSRRS